MSGARLARNGTVVNPGEVFSFWRAVGNPTKRKGSEKGLVISRSGFVADYGGGLCQMANMIHWLVLNSPLTVTELHHHSDALFPDDRRRVPFGTGTSVCYNNIDYRFRNDTDQPVGKFDTAPVRKSAAGAEDGTQRSAAASDASREFRSAFMAIGGCYGVVKGWKSLAHAR